jgi:hypothetical protein
VCFTSWAKLWVISVHDCEIGVGDSEICFQSYARRVDGGSIESWAPNIELQCHGVEVISAFTSCKSKSTVSLKTENVTVALCQMACLLKGARNLS